MDEENQKRNCTTLAGLFIGNGTRGFVYKTWCKLQHQYNII